MRTEKAHYDKGGYFYTPFPPLPHGHVWCFYNNKILQVCPDKDTVKDRPLITKQGIKGAK